ncbi:MAG: response regulator [Lachnospiraceae bacterium]|nr:response regulator [Lachnospiraceae bacterium]
MKRERSLNLWSVHYIYIGLLLIVLVRAIFSIKGGNGYEIAGYFGFFFVMLVVGYILRIKIYKYIHKIDSLSEEYKETTDIYRTLNNQLMDLTSATVVYLDNDLRIQICSREITKDTNEWTETDVVGKKLIDVCTPQKYQSLLDEYKEKPYETIVEVEGEDGEKQWFKKYVDDFVYNGEKRGVFCYESNITADKRVQMEYEQLTKLRSNMLIAISHELNTPLNAISGSLELLSLSNNLSESDVGHLKNIRDAYRGLKNLIFEITDFTKIGNNNFELENVEFAVRDVLDEICPLVYGKAREKGLEFLIKVEPQIPRKLVGDREKLIRVLKHLLNNALNYTTQGYIKLSILEHRAKNGNLIIHYQVSDTGVGMSDEKRAAVFGETSELLSESKIEGIGIGLALCQEFVRAMGGELMCESKKGVGSNFFFNLNTEANSGKAFASVTEPEKCKVVCYTENSIRKKYIKECCNDLGIESIVFAGDGDVGDECTHLIIDPESTNADYWLKKEFSNPCLKVVIVNGSNKNLGIVNYADRVIYEPLSVSNFASIFNEVKMGENRKNGRKDSLIFKTTGIRALVIDDNEVNLMIVSNMLQQYNIQEECVSQVKLGIQKYKDNDYDIIFMDYLMPGMNGVEATKIIRKYDKGVNNPYIIALSANVNEAIRKEFEDAGADLVMSKPMELRELSDTLRKILPKDHILFESSEVGKTGEEEDEGEHLSQLKEALSKVKYLDIDLGLSYIAGSIRNYVHILRACCTNVQEQIDFVKAGYEMLSPSDLQINFHSLKGILLNTGVTVLSERAKEMEQAAKDNNSVYIEEHAKEFITEIETFRSTLQEALNSFEKSEKEEKKPKENTVTLSNAELSEQLEKAIHHIKRFEFDEINRIMEEVLRSNLEDKREMLENAYDLIQGFRYEEAQEIIEKVKSELI